MLMAKLRIPTRRHFYKKKERKVKMKLDKHLFRQALQRQIHDDNSRLCDYEEMKKSLQNASKAAKLPTISDGYLSLRTRRLFANRHQLLAANSNRLDLATVSKALRFSIKDDIYQRQLQRIHTAVKQRTSLHRATKDNTIALTQLSQLRRKDGTLATTPADRADVVKGFYNELFASTTNFPPPIITVNDMPPLFTPSETNRALNQIRHGKSAGPDNITPEMLHLVRSSIVEPLTIMFNECLSSGAIPNGLPDSIVTLIFKKGDVSDLKNFRPIALLSVIYKTLTTTIGHRMEKTLNWNQPTEQAGFRKGYSTSDHILSVHEIISKAVEYKFPLYIAFVDYSKAFDSIEFPAVWSALLRHDVHPAFIRLLKNIYDTATVKIQMEPTPISIDVHRGVRQGDVISPVLFSAVIEEIFRKLNWTEHGLNINGEHLTNLRYADDIVLFSHDAAELQSMLEDLVAESAVVGLKINMEKTFVMSNSPEVNISVEGSTIAYCKDFIYLGQIISFEVNQGKEISRRIQAAWSAFNNYHQFLKSRSTPLSLKRRLYISCIEPALLYGAETWALRDAERRRLQSCQRKIMRKMTGVTLLDHKTVKWLATKTKLPPVLQKATHQKWNFGQKVALMDNQRWTKKIVEWTPREWKRIPGRPRMRWRDEFQAELGANWSSVAQKNKRRWICSKNHRVRKYDI